MRLRLFFSTTLILLNFVMLKGQTGFVRGDTIPVSINNQPLRNPWAGGLNFCQLSPIDLDLDGTDDLFIFDRSGNKITTYLNGGTPNQVDYTSAPEYISRFPVLHDWAILRDYNCDGMADIFTYSVGSMAVYKNVSTIQNGLQFQLVVFILKSDRSPNSTHFMSNIPISRIDIPVVRDIDGDGDLDILTFGQSSTTVEYHRNMSKEVYNTCDSLNYQWESQCWGDFNENALNSSITLNQTCPGIPLAPNDPVDPTLSTARINAPDQVADGAHAGSCMECLNVDNDGDQDILVGDLSNRHMTFIRNGGTSSLAHMDSIDALYPVYDLTLDQTIFPCPFRLDVDNDGNDDILFSPDAENTSENEHSIWFYHNLGTTDSVYLEYVQDNFMQNTMIEHGEGAYPVFFDYDNDGRIDLFMGNYGYHATGPYTSKIALYRNIGSSTQPSFSLITTDFANIAGNNLGLLCLAPTFGDLDGDGDKDMLIGDFHGKLHFFRKDPGPADNFVLAQSFYMNIDDGGFATPQLVDMNYDGLLDLVIGDQNGKLRYYQNVGTATSPNFTTSTAVFGGVNVRDPYTFTGYSVPFVYTENSAHYMLVGSERGFIYKYGNIDNNLSGQFTLIDSMYISTREGGRLAPSVADLNNDGLFDVVIGNYAGGMSVFLGDNSISTGQEFGELSGTMHVYPNPATDAVTLELLNYVPNEHPEFVLYDMTGREVLRVAVTQTKQQIGVSQLPAGVYLSVLESDRGLVQRGRVLISR